MSNQDLYAQSIIKLFIPVFISRIGLFTMSIVSTIMLANYDKLHLGYQSIGDAPIMIILLAINGLVQGVLFITSEAFSKRDYKSCGAALNQSIRQCILLSFIALPLALIAPFFLNLFNNYTEENIRISSSVMRFLSIGVPFSALYMVCQFFLQGIKRPWVSSWFIIAANILNLLLNWIFIYGKLGAPEMGAVGVAITTSVVRVILGVSIIAYIYKNKEFSKFFGSKSIKKMVINKRQRELGIGATANMLSGEVAFSFTLFFISSFSILMTSAYTLVFRIIVIASIASASMAVANSTIIGKGLTRKNIKIVKNAIFSTLNLNTFIMGAVCIFLFLFPTQFLSIITNDKELIDVAKPFLEVGAFVLFFIGAQNILIINLRAMNDLIIPSIIMFIFYTLMVPMLCLFFANNAFEGSIPILIASILTSIGLFIRIVYLIPNYNFEKVYKKIN